MKLDILNILIKIQEILCLLVLIGLTSIGIVGTLPTVLFSGMMFVRALWKLLKEEIDFLIFLIVPVSIPKSIAILDKIKVEEKVTEKFEPLFQNERCRS